MRVLTHMTTHLRRNKNSCTYTCRYYINPWGRPLSIYSIVVDIESRVKMENESKRADWL